MKKISVIGATLLEATALCAAPISLHLSQDKDMSLSVDKAQAYIPAGTPCKEAAKLAMIGRPATPLSVSASKPGRPRIRAPSLISRIEIAMKGRGNRSGSLSHS